MKILLRYGFCHTIVLVKDSKVKQLISFKLIVMSYQVPITIPWMSNKSIATW